MKESGISCDMDRVSKRRRYALISKQKRPNGGKQQMISELTNKRDGSK